MPKSVSFAKPAPAAGSAATITFCGLTSRWMTLRSCAWREGVADGHADLRDVAVGDGAGLHQVGERAAVDELGDEVDRVGVLAELVEGDDAGVVQPRRDAGLARGARGNRLVAVLGDDLDGDLALELLVEGQVDDAEAARSELALELVAVQDEAAERAGRGLDALAVRRIERARGDPRGRQVVEVVDVLGRRVALVEVVVVLVGVVRVRNVVVRVEAARTLAPERFLGPVAGTPTPRGTLVERPRSRLGGRVVSGHGSFHLAWGSAVAAAPLPASAARMPPTDRSYSL